MHECARAIVNGNGTVSGQKFSKFFVSHVKESLAGHMSVMELN
jgi:hypothetical protein